MKLQTFTYEPFQSFSETLQNQIKFFFRENNGVLEIHTKVVPVTLKMMPHNMFYEHWPALRTLELIGLGESLYITFHQDRISVEKYRDNTLVLRLRSISGYNPTSVLNLFEIFLSSLPTSRGIPGDYDYILSDDDDE